mmetsp:Transcript_4860/g.8788  ORF Transcript_4860/g.8788 Transcript_4860/m.8788 type:complete len:714 (-) Transcript_4860:2848-4989(-)
MLSHAAAAAFELSLVATRSLQTYPRAHAMAHRAGRFRGCRLLRTTTGRNDHGFANIKPSPIDIAHRDRIPYRCLLLGATSGRNGDEADAEVATNKAAPLRTTKVVRMSANHTAMAHQVRRLHGRALFGARRGQKGADGAGEGQANKPVLYGGCLGPYGKRCMHSAVKDTGSFKDIEIPHDVRRSLSGKMNLETVNSSIFGQAIRDIISSSPDRSLAGGRKRRIIQGEIRWQGWAVPEKFFRKAGVDTACRILAVTELFRCMEKLSKANPGLVLSLDTKELDSLMRLLAGLPNITVDVLLSFRDHFNVKSWLLPVLDTASRTRDYKVAFKLLNEDVKNAQGKFRVALGKKDRFDKNIVEGVLRDMVGNVDDPASVVFRRTVYEYFICITAFKKTVPDFQERRLAAEAVGKIEALYKADLRINQFRLQDDPFEFYTRDIFVQLLAVYAKLDDRTSLDKLLSVMKDKPLGFTQEHFQHILRVISLMDSPRTFLRDHLQTWIEKTEQLMITPEIALYVLYAYSQTCMKISPGDDPHVTDWWKYATSVFEKGVENVQDKSLERKLYEQLARIYFCNGEFDLAKSLIEDRMVPRGFPVQAHTFNSLIYYWARQGEPAAALGIVADMQAHEAAPDTFTLDYILAALLGETQDAVVGMKLPALKLAVSEVVGNYVALSTQYSSARPSRYAIQRILECCEITKQEDEAERIRKMARVHNVVY